MAGCTAWSKASWTVAYSGRKSGIRSRSRTWATAGWAPHNRKLACGQLLVGWLATVAKMVAQTGSRASTPLRSQIIPNGCAARSLSRTRRIWGVVNRLIWPLKVTTRQPSRVECAIASRPPPSAGAGRDAARPRHQVTPVASGVREVRLTGVSRRSAQLPGARDGQIIGAVNVTAVSAQDRACPSDVARRQSKLAQDRT